MELYKAFCHLVVPLWARLPNIFNESGRLGTTANLFLKTDVLPSGDLAEPGRRLRDLGDRGRGEPGDGRGAAVPRARGGRQQHLLPHELDLPPQLRQDQVQRLHLQPHPQGAVQVRSATSPRLF